MAFQPKPGAARPRNLHTQAQIRRDTWLQIFAPLALAALVTLVLVVLIILPGGAGVRRPLADVSLILLILPTAVVGLIALALLIGVNVGLYLGLTRLPPYFKIAQDFVTQAADRVQGGVKKASNGVISIRATIAAARRAASDLGTLLPIKRRN